VTGETPHPYEAQALLRAAARWAGVPVETISRGGRLVRYLTIVRWAVIAEMRSRGYGLSETGRALNLDHASISNADKRCRQMDKDETMSGDWYRKLRDHLTTEAPPVGARHVLAMDGRFHELRRVGRKDDGGQIWRLADGK
jgi:hypothetical protein